ncbi:MAG: translocation/assembly module TamB domain-containing protein, partial [Vicinamibacteria bacterium]
IGSGSTFLVVDCEVLPLSEPISWTARASGRVDHEISRLVLADLGWAFTGATDVDLRVSSDASGEAPFVLEGRGSFEGARLLVRDPAIAFTNVSGALELSGNTIRLEHLTTDAGGGKVEAAGTLTLEGAAIGNLDLRASAESVRLNYPEGLRSEIGGSFRLLGDPEALELSGEASLGRALFSRDINVETQILQSLSRVARLSSANDFSSRVALDLRVRAGDAFRIDNNLARMEASVNMAVAGTLASPEVSGNASSRPGGRFRFGGNTYRVESGRIQFRRYPVEPPELDITARTSVAEYDVRLVLRGSTDDLQTELTSPSHPQLSQGDVASLLLTGRTLSEISGAGRTVVGERMASYLGSTLADLAQLGIGEALPFDIVTVEPALIAGEADPGARFTLGAELTEALSLVYSIGLN